MKKNILILDDEESIRRILQRILENNNYNCFMAHDTRAAREHLSQQEIDLILCDINMPGESGIEFLESMKDQLKDIAVIMVTAMDSHHRIEQSIELGIYGYIFKPFRQNQIMVCVHNALRRSELERNERVYNQRLKEEVKRQTSLLEITIERLKASEMELKISENNIKSQLNFLNTLINAIPNPLYYKDMKGNYIGCNSSFAKYIGLEQAEIIGKSVHNIAPKDLADITYKIDQDLFKNPGHRAYETTLKFADGLKHNVILNKATYADIDGRLAGLLGVIIDVTEQKKTEIRLKESQAQIIQQEKMASIGQLAAGVAHEINNPTGYVSSNLTTLENYQNDIFEIIKECMVLISYFDSEAIKAQLLTHVIKKLEIIEALRKRIDLDFLLDDIPNLIRESREGLERIKKIVIDLKNFAHPGTDELKYTNINENIDSTLNIVWNEIKYKAVVEKEYGEFPDVLCYPQQLNQVFMNILVNAAHAIKSDGVIKIKTCSRDNNITIEISDNGEGIPEKNITRIYDPFFTTKEVGKGTGLGLNVAYNIVKKHNGNIDVKSQVGKGTTFYISIPLEPVNKVLNSD
ncbi:MAG: response regulator [Desulfatiglans sp.]|nr:response regulator [Desulfatiglans sp.]